MEQVKRRHIQRGRHLHLPAEVGQTLREVEAGQAVVETAIDVRACDVQESLRSGHPGQPGDDAHRHGCGRSGVTIEHRTVGVGEFELLHRRERRPSPGLPATVRGMLGLDAYCNEFDESPRFLDHAAVGPLSRRARSTLQEHVELLSMPDQAPVPGLLAKWEDAKALGARLLATTPEHVTFVSSTSHGLFAAAFGLSGGNVVVPSNEFPANQYPWLRAEQAGLIELRRVPIRDGRVTPDALRPAIDRDTQAVAVSAVGFLSGYRVDLAGLRELVGDALLVVDAVQALGALRVELTHADLVVAGSQKWMRAGIGSAIVAASDRLLERHRPLLTGWVGVEDMYGSGPIPHPSQASAGRFALGSSPLLAVGTWRGALEVTLEAGIDAIEDAVLARAEAFEAAVDQPGVELVQPGRKGSERSSIISFRVPGRDPARVAAALTADGFVFTHREGTDTIRVAPHATTPLTTATDLGDSLKRALG